MSNFVYPEDLMYYVQSIRPFDLVDIGSPQWFNTHEMIVQLSHQSFLEAAEHREEEVKELLITQDKLKVLIHEAYSVMLWKTRVLPHLLDINPNPQATFLIYSVFYHEGAVIALLDTALFHSSVCEALKDEAIDLIDYCMQGITQVIGLVSLGYSQNMSKFDVDESVLSEMERQKRDIIFKIGLRCISILNYVVDNADALTLGATSRLVTSHDLPWLLIELLQMRPWQRKTENGWQKYIDDKWTTLSADNMQKVIKYEAQTWFCLRNIIFNKNLMEMYDINNERRTQLLRCQGLLNDVILDQLPPLIELKEFVCRLAVSGPLGAAKQPMLLEELPQIRENIMVAADKFGGFVKIAHKQESIFLTKDKDFILTMAQRLNEMYKTDLMAAYEPQSNGDTDDKGTTNGAQINKCIRCGEFAEKKCGNCRTTYYCSKNCQSKDWPTHKQTCCKVQKA